MNRNVIDRRYTQFSAVAILSVLVFNIGLFMQQGLLVQSSSQDTVSLLGALLMQQTGVVLVFVGGHSLRYAEAWGEFFRTVDWDQRFGSAPAIPISPQKQPYVNGVLSILSGFGIVALPYFL